MNYYTSLAPENFFKVDFFRPMNSKTLPQITK